MAYTFLGIFLGILTRAVVPYIVSLKKNPDLKWQNKYLMSAFIGLILAFIASMLISSQLSKELGFIGSFTAAFTLHSLSRETQKLLGFY